MTDNFFSDNPDLQYHLDSLDLEEAVDILEDGYRYHRAVPWRAAQLCRRQGQLPAAPGRAGRHLLPTRSRRGRPRQTKRAPSLRMGR